jgi:hypothetical protein
MTDLRDLTDDEILVLQFVLANFVSHLRASTADFLALGYRDSQNGAPVPLVNDVRHFQNVAQGLLDRLTGADPVG